MRGSGSGIDGPERPYLRRDPCVDHYSDDFASQGSDPGGVWVCQDHFDQDV